MLSNFWIELRREYWNRLESLTAQAERGGVKSLSRPELRELGLLYRQAAADLSATRADSSARSLEQYLNRLTARAHNFVYAGRSVNAAGLWRFFAYGYPRLLRRLSAYVIAATAITLATAVFGALITALRPDFGVMFFGAQRIADLDHGKMWTDTLLSAKAPYSSQIMTNNIGVCFLTFAAGITFGLGTIYLLWNNGLMLGVIGVICAQHHMSLSLWSFIAAHGALELPSIMLAGAAGLRLGAGMLFPGILSRREALATAGAESVQLLAGTVPLLVVAGLFEAFLSPLHVSPALKFSVGAVLFTALCLWLGSGGRATVVAEEA